MLDTCGAQGASSTVNDHFVSSHTSAEWSSQEVQYAEEETGSQREGKWRGGGSLGEQQVGAAELRMRS